MDKILVISGATASNKSTLALQIAQLKFNNYQSVNIINADALQIYDSLPILSSQPSFDEQKLVSHSLYSYLKPQQNCSVGLWLDLVKNIIEENWQNHILPIVVGGTGMYISKLIEGINEMPEISDKIKQEAVILFEEIGSAEYKKILKTLIENEFHHKIDTLDKQRLIRLYEVIKQSQKSIWWWQKQPTKKLFKDENFIHLNICLDRKLLYRNCEQRFLKMLDLGGIDEVKNNLNLSGNVTQTIGFFEIKKFLTQEITKQQMIDLTSQRTRNYAKRQLTWFRNQLPNKNIFSNLQEALSFTESLKL